MFNKLQHWNEREYFLQSFCVFNDSFIEGWTLILYRKVVINGRCIFFVMTTYLCRPDILRDVGLPVLSPIYFVMSAFLCGRRYIAWCRPTCSLADIFHDVGLPVRSPIYCVIDVFSYFLLHLPTSFCLFNFRSLDVFLIHFIWHLFYFVALSITGVGLLTAYQ